MKIKDNLKYKVVMVFLFCFLIIPVKTVKAANPTEVTIEANKTYTSYDVTGDRKKDTVRIKAENGLYGISKVSLAINGKTYVITRETCLNINAKIYTLKNGKPFIYLFLEYDNDTGPVCGIFQYKSGKLKQVVNCLEFFGKKGKYGYDVSGSVEQVNGNKITVDFWIMSYTLGYTKYSCQFVYKNGTLRRINNQVSATPSVGTLSMQKNVKVYMKPTGKKAAYTLKEGKRVKVTGAYVKSGKFSIRIKDLSKKKTVWIKCLKEFPSDGKPLFKEVIFSG